MKKWLKITLNVLGWGAILAYFIVAAQYCTDRRADESLQQVSVRVTDYHERQLISSDTVHDWLLGDSIVVLGMPLASVNTRIVCESVASHTFIRSVKAYTEIYADRSGRLIVEVAQRLPVMRVIMEGGYDFYISQDNWILPSREGSPEYVPVVSGNFPLPFSSTYFGSLDQAVDEEQKKSDKSYLFLYKLINFVKLVSDDPFWSTEIVQVEVSDSRAKRSGSPWREPEAELIPRVGDHVIVLGTLDHARQKLDKLRLFYANVLDYEGWDSYSRIDVSNKGQVVCR